MKLKRYKIKLPKSKTIYPTLIKILKTLFRSTLPYRAPELFQVETNDIINSKTDIWSLGCILYSFVYLEGPFDQYWLKGDSVHLAIQSLKFDKSKLANYSADITKLVDDCIYHDPEFRKTFQKMTNIMIISSDENESD